MKRLITCLLAILIVIGGATSAHARWKPEGPWRGPCDGWINGEFVEHDTPLGVQQARTRHLIRCVFAIVAPAETSTALAIGDRESHFDHEANNGSCGGVYQHKFVYWAGRVAAYFWSKWIAPFLRPGRIFNAYVNVWTTARMVRDVGWSPWGG